MKRFTKWFVLKTIPNWQNTSDQEVRSRYGIVGGWTSIVVNIVLSIVKIVIAVFTGSVSLIADAIHTLSDVATSVVILWSFHIAAKPADEKHPFGHGRMEAISTIVVAVILIYVGIELGKSGVHRILNPTEISATWPVMFIIVLTIIIKEGLGRISRELSQMIKSSALEADFWHHRIDAISSILVLIAFAGQRLGVLWLDGVMGLGVSLMIVWTGWLIIRNGIDDLLGTSPDKDFVDDVRKTALAFDGVIDVHDLIVHQYGQNMVMSMHVAMDERLSFKVAHRLGTIVGLEIDCIYNTHTTVHIDPVNSDSEIREIKG
ncbi:cation transporter [bacterium]|nr:cation transporter [bacterium]